MCCSVQREGHSSREQATSCPAASEIPAPKPPRLDSDQTTNTHTHSQAHKVNLNTYTPQNSSSEYVTRLVRLNTTHLVLAYCSCLPQIPKQTQVYTLIHITHINTAHTHTETPIRWEYCWILPHLTPVRLLLGKRKRSLV